MSDYNRPNRPKGLGHEDDIETDPFGGKISEDDIDTQIPGRKASQRGRRGSIDDGIDTDIVSSAPFETEIASPEKEITGLLWVTEGARRGKIYNLYPGVRIGKREGEILIDDKQISSLHARITLKDEVFLLWDFGSTNGTYVNGKQIFEATPLYENDVIKMGNTSLIVKLLEPKSRPTATRKKSTTTKRKK